MNTTACSNSIQWVRFNSAGFHRTLPERGVPTATASQEKLPGFQQALLQHATVGMVGCGGIGSTIIEHLVRKGCGRIEVCDGDDVDLGNLGRQKFFPEDIGKNKAICGARNAIRHASWPTEIRACPLWFEDAIHKGFVSKPSAVIVGPDRDSARLNVSRHYYDVCPVIIVGIGTQADHGYVFVQKPGGPCFACVFPEAIGNKREPCPGAPAMIDILLATSALVLTALDSVLMKGRRITWNYWDFYLSGAVPTQPLIIEKRADCPICSKVG